MLKSPLPIRTVFCLLFLSVVRVDHLKGEVGKLPPQAHPAREFRAAWIATVANIDWPTRRDLSTEQQQSELIGLLDTVIELNLNAVILQVRPACDALYASQLEPWSEYLTGRMGQAPEPLYDPLKFAVQEAHARGLELHAWLNPYRALHPSAKGPLSDDHISKTKPNLVKQYGDYLWLDPGEPEAAQHSLAVILDVVERYDVDGIHFDDYFYPYPIKNEQGNELAFPDDASWEQASKRNDSITRDDWRRQNVNRFVKKLYDEIKQSKPWVKFGISPFGIWRPGNPPQIQGFDQYSAIYADAKKWFAEGWLDYFSPQLYWRMGPPAQSYPALLHWWHEQNEQGRHLWPGNYTSRLLGEGTRHWTAEEIVAQIWATRAQEGATGNIHFSIKALLRNSGGIADALATGPYRQPALAPASPWLAEPDQPAPPKPAVSLSNSKRGALVQFQLADNVKPWLWVVRSRHGKQWHIAIVPGQKSEHDLTDLASSDGDKSPDLVAVSAVDRIGREGPMEIVSSRSN